MKIARFVFALFGINTYVVWDPETSEAAIIDPGMSSDHERDAIVSFLNRENLTVKHLINTHLHIDHVAGNGFVAERFQVGTKAHKSDAMLGQRVAEQAAMFGLDFEPGGVEIETPLEDGDNIDIGNGQLKVIHVPGHSPGGIALYDAKGGYVISGDSLFQGSIGRTDLPGGNMDTLIHAVRNKLLTLPPDTVVYPGHGDPTTIDNEQRYNPFLK